MKDCWDLWVWTDFDHHITDSGLSLLPLLLFSLLDLFHISATFSAANKQKEKKIPGIILGCKKRRDEKEGSTCTALMRERYSICLGGLYLYIMRVG